MDYNQCLNEMYALRRFGIKLGLSSIAHVLSELNNPHHQFASIHIAGTNGKGSVAAMIANILRISGYRIGLYTSPHLIRFNERVVINGDPIDDDSVVKLWNRVKTVHKPDRELTFFEYTTVMAFCAFADKNVDIAVVETGMGGRLDATNILAPRLTIITNIGLDHQEYLGKKIKDIAYEKAGIIKPGTACITDVQTNKAFDVISDTARTLNAPLYQLGRDIHVRKRKDGFSYSGFEFEWHQLQCALQGGHQMRNAGLALCAYECIEGKKANWKPVHEGLRTVQWPGRMEIISHSPTTILDGAHNPMATRQLVKYLKEIKQDRSLTLMIAILNDKPYESMLTPLIQIADLLIISQAKIDRSMDPQILKDFAKPFIQNIRIIHDISEAYFEIRQNSDPSDIICITGSLYIVGEVKAALNENSQEIFLA